MQALKSACNYGDGIMASNKLSRINDDIQFALSKYIKEVKDPRVQQGLISITRVETTGDLRYCKVWISVLGMTNEKEMYKGLKSASGWLRKELGHALNLRYTPELVFEVDHSIEYGAHINELINSIEIKHDEENND